MLGNPIQTIYAAKLASKFGKVVLSGTGGDELFGGYPWRYYRAVVNDDFDHYVREVFRLLADGWFRAEVLPQLIGSGLVRSAWQSHRMRSSADVFNEHASMLTRPEDYVNHSLYFEAKTFLNGLLIVDDKLAMAHGLESRVPFLDNDLVDFAMRLPARMKLGNLTEVVSPQRKRAGRIRRSVIIERTKDGKLVLRQDDGASYP